MKAEPRRFTEIYLQQLPVEARRFVMEKGLDKEMGRVESWSAAVSKKFTDLAGWSIDNLILNYWKIECRYSHEAGEAYSRFLNGLKQEKIYGTKCGSCRRILIPPRSFCEWCFVKMEEWVEHSGEGTVATYSLSYIGTDPGVRLRDPIPVAVIWFTDTIVKHPSSKTVLHAAGILHKLGECRPDEVYIGLHVAPVWKPAEQRVGSILDIEYFKPVR